ncbi:hypothetical protein MBANPS3_010242 [Mucor bainieri]
MDFMLVYLVKNPQVANQVLISTASRNSVSSCATDAQDTDSPSVRIPKSSSADKENIILRYDRLDRKKMWTLPNGTVVEDVMKEVALKFDYEHPSHSLILDVTDTCWSKVFQEHKDREREESRDFRLAQLPAVAPEIQNFCASLWFV